MKSQKGFSLIELLVVATIIIVLSAIGIVSYSNSGKSARDSRRKADLETVRQAMVLYRAERGSYPNISTGSHTAGKYNTLVADLAYFKHLSRPTPIDPKNDTTYFYSASSTSLGQDFCLCAQLESNKGNVNGRNCSNIGSTTTGTHYCVNNP